MKRIAVALLALLAVLGVVAVLVGVGLRTLWAPPETVTAAITVQDPSPYVVTAPGVLEMYSGTASVTVEGAADTPVFIARGREQDVTAWARNAPVDTIIGLDGPGVLALRAGTGEEALPDPRTADLWLDSSTQTGQANYVWREAPGRFQLVFATDGTQPAPSRISITWPNASEPSPWAIPLIVLGGLLLVGALALAVGMAVRRRRAQARETSEALGPRVAPPPGPGGATAQASSSEDQTRAVPVVDSADTEAVPPVAGSDTEALRLPADQHDTFVADRGLVLGGDESLDLGRPDPGTDRLGTDRPDVPGPGGEDADPDPGRRPGGQH